MTIKNALQREEKLPLMLQAASMLYVTCCWPCCLLSNLVASLFAPKPRADEVGEKLLPTLFGVETDTDKALSTH